MNYQTFKVHFILKTNKLNQKGFAPIFARIITNGLKMEITTNRNLEPINWSRTAELAFPTSKANKELNQYLETFRSKIYQAYTSALSSEEGITAESIKRELFPKPKKERHMLIETALQHNEQFEKLIGIKYSKAHSRTTKPLSSTCWSLYH